MNSIPLEYYLTVAAVLFAVGCVGFLLRRNLLVLLMSIEVMLNAVNLTLVAFNRMHARAEQVAGVTPPPQHGGQIFAFFIIVVAAAEAAVGLAIVLSFFRVRKTVRSDDADLLRN
ncbi:MAG: NADH-quinone oxidoreductase subunit NuoK [Polyangiaceae bacterium]